MIPSFLHRVWQRKDAFNHQPFSSFIRLLGGCSRFSCVHTHQTCSMRSCAVEGHCSSHWLSPFFRHSGSSPDFWLWQWSFCLLQPFWHVTKHFCWLQDFNLFSIPVQRRGCIKQRCFYSSGDAPKRKSLWNSFSCLWNYTGVPEVCSSDSSDLWSGSSHLCGHAALSKRPRLVFLPKVSSGVSSDRGTLFLITVTSTFILLYVDKQRCVSFQDAVGQLAASTNTFPSLLRELLHIIFNFCHLQIFFVYVVMFICIPHISPPLCHQVVLQLSHDIFLHPSVHFYLQNFNVLYCK